MVQTVVAALRVRIDEFLLLRGVLGKRASGSSFHSTHCPLFILPEIGLCIFHYSTPDTPESVAFIRSQSNFMNLNGMCGGGRDFFQLIQLRNLEVPGNGLLMKLRAKEYIYKEKCNEKRL